MMKSPFYHIRHAHKTFDHFHQNLHHAFVLIVGAMIGMLWWASHILMPSTANRQWGWFVTNDFREQNPSDNNIKYALFGDGTPGATAYTRLRESSCIPTSVQTLPANFQWWTLSDYTIYILDSGTYTLTSNIVINSDCSALIGKGDVYLKPTNASITPISQYHTANNIIIDNIKIDW